MHLEKNRTYTCTFPVQRKEIDVVKVRFTMRYSSRKLSNDKVITTACNFWRQTACSFQVMSGNILFLGNKIFEIPPFFQIRPGDLGKKVHTFSLRFSALKQKPCIDSGASRGGAWEANLPLFLDQTEARRAENKIFKTAPPPPSQPLLPPLISESGWTLIWRSGSATDRHTIHVCSLLKR